MVRCVHVFSSLSAPPLEASPCSQPGPGPGGSGAMAGVVARPIVGKGLVEA